MITDRNKFNFVTICIGFSFLLTNASVALAQATSNAQQETNQQQSKDQNQAAVATISVVSSKDDAANAIINEPINGVVHAFSPRLDYSNEWRPVGRGDPLKNDPTFDYSPPTLEHVRYWAETTKDSSSSNSKEESGSSKQDANSARLPHPSKQDILMLGMPNEHLRGSSAHVSQAPHQHVHMGPHGMPHLQPYHQPHPGGVKNAKGETPLLQPKYTSVRRSYYAQQLPTRLMPPPMQANSPPINTFNVPMKPSQVHTEYRHSMSGVPHVSTMPSMGPSSMATVTHMKAHHHASMSTPSSSSWMYSSPPAKQHLQQHHPYAMPSGSAASMPTSSQSSRMPLPHAYDSHPQDSHHYFSYTRPSANSLSSHMPQESYSPNSLRHSASSAKQSGTGRKPWLHELLQKEVVKTSAKPSYSASTNKFAYETTKPIYERMPSTNSISGGFTPFTPVTFVSAPPTIATSTTTSTTTTTRAPQPPPNAITPSSFYPTTSTTYTPPTTSATARVIYTTPTTTTTPRTTTSTTSSRLLIPTTSNLAYRPTVAPMQMTTDSLFSHYKQPEAPLRGPMYLIIEGHSKVKKYGKNGINLNLPKIVPVVPKREPVVRVAEPGEEKRGTPETFQVQHLHVKTSTTTTTTARPVTTLKSVTMAKPVTTTTTKPTASTSTVKPSTSAKPSTTAKLPASTNPTKAAMKPLISSTTTTTRPAATTASPKAISTTAATPKSTNKTTDKTAGTAKPTSAIVKPSTAAPKPALNEALTKMELPNEPPTGMQGLLSLLDASLGGLFAEQPLKTPAPIPARLSQTKQTTTPSTVLQAVKSSTNTALPTQSAIVPVIPDARIRSNAGRIVAADADLSGSAEFSFTTDIPPREVRQVFDYDQRPESRLKDFVIESFDGAEDEGASAFYEDEFEEYSDDEISNGGGNQQPIKRMDTFADGDEEEFMDDYEDVELGEQGMGDVVPDANSVPLAHTQAKLA
ncbi:mucin-5AC [Anastrepha obliqua]|uniref:mucin-5AC n=1 Tax=Anastrepha obliqua TaxID=95512 RepID=UPI00240A4B78|nr:mucin-5AC [Anastrepha obliqua]